MFTNYAKTALAQLLRNRLYSCINIAGFAIGLAACILIGLYVRHELSFDRFHPDADRMYRVSRNYYPGNGTPDILLAANAPPVAALLKQDFHEVEASTRILNRFDILVKYGEKSGFESRLLFADSNLFDFFHFDWLQGDPVTALAAPGKVVLTESMAGRYFGNEDPIGKTLELQYDIRLEVSGVIQNLPDNTHISADGFASLTTLSSRSGADFESSWGSNTFYTYVKLREDASASKFASALPAFLARHYQPEGNFRTDLRLQALTDIHLHSSELQEPMKAPGNIATVRSFITVALCLLLIAGFNFMNLSIARSTLRGKEVGMRKAIGAARGQVTAQFLGESVLASLIALLVAVALVELLLPVSNALLGISLSLQLSSDPGFLFSLLGATVAVGILSGIYPALYLSGFSSARVLRGDVGRGRGGQAIRNGVVILQFSTAIALVVATVVVHLQLAYTRNLDLGFDKERLLIIDHLDTGWPAFKGELLSQPGVLAATASNKVPGEDNANAFMARYEGGTAEGRGMQFLLVDYDFFSTYGIKLLAGRGFNSEFGNDRFVYPDENNPKTSAGFILSAMAVRQFGWTPETGLGKWFEIGIDNDFSRSLRGPVVGVVEDIHSESAATPIEPVVYMLAPLQNSELPSLSKASIRLSGDRLDATLAFIDARWAEVFPGKPMMRAFLDDNLEALYLQDANLGSMFTWFAFLAVVVASLGLFGLASFNAQCRTKEIGIRKVMGGSVWSIVVLLTNDFSKLVLISNVFAWPVAYYAMQRWLENFAYRIDLTPVIFIGSGLVALCTAWVTVGGTAAKAASRKPVLALRYE